MAHSYCLRTGPEYRGAPAEPADAASPGLHLLLPSQPNPDADSRLLNTAMLSLVFVLIGYSSYLIVPIRSSFHPTINENNPEDVLSFVSYLKREQYGSRALLSGP